MSVTIGFAMCGSYCTHSKALIQIEKLKEKGYNILPIISENTAKTDTKFGKSKDLKEKLIKITNNDIIDSIVKAEPIGPKNMCDILVVAPCTGNTLSKMALGITDTSVTMAVKSQLRIEKPVLLCIATNDALAASAPNIGKLLNTKNIYFVPFSQDDPNKKPHSLVADFELIPYCIEKALRKEQEQPIIK